MPRSKVWPRSPTGERRRGTRDGCAGGFVDQGIESPKSVVTNLLTEGSDAAQRISPSGAANWSEVAQEIISGLADLGDAGDVLDGPADAGEWAYDNTIGRIPGL